MWADEDEVEEEGVVRLDKHTVVSASVGAGSFLAGTGTSLDGDGVASGSGSTSAAGSGSDSERISTLVGRRPPTSPSPTALQARP